MHAKAKSLCEGSKAIKADNLLAQQMPNFPASKPSNQRRINKIDFGGSIWQLKAKLYPLFNRQ